MTPTGTPLRNVRIDDPLWSAALARAAERGESVSDVIRRALEEYVGGEAPVPSFILKTTPADDLYVEWSTIVEAPISWGTRREMVARGIPDERLVRADAKGSSCQGDISDWYTWAEGDGLIYQQQGVLPRSRLGDLIGRLAHDELAEVSDLLEPFDG